MSSLTFVGFGFGPIQSGLFAYEAFASGRYGRIVIVEVAGEVVRGLRQSGSYGLNIARRDGIERHTVGPVEVYDPNSPGDRDAISAALREASEVATAVPSVSFYRSASDGSIHRLLAEALRERVRPEPLIIYAAENHHRAAAILRENVLSALPSGEAKEIEERARFLDTVIGKMSGVITDGGEIERLGLLPLWEKAGRAHLVEEFRRILVTRPKPGHGGRSIERGLDAFEEKDDLRPFEEAKLYGHNATHALLAYLAAAVPPEHAPAGRRLERMSELAGFQELVAFARDAFLVESGRALRRRHEGRDPLFAPKAWEAHVDDLIERMLNPFLVDQIERVGRDPARKLGWSDRLVGTMRLALEAGIEPSRF
ncbi:MAG TPA: hypothetical protein VK116_00310, partial [Planctomycetota bacterium]|nr:hypothetical protein [Planctomycetota bacterium]